jgi:hypothetical protein
LVSGTCGGLLAFAVDLWEERGVRGWGLLAYEEVDPGDADAGDDAEEDLGVGVSIFVCVRVDCCLNLRMLRIEMSR